MREGGISRAALVTGCSSGIGQATALRLVRAGWPVYATARKVETLRDLAAAGCQVLALDVTDERSARAAVAAVLERTGAVGVLVNNAGYSQSGAVESVPVELARRQFETNVLGPLRLTQLVLPGMRQQHWGRIVNVSSMGGRLTFPGGGVYHASKYALEALSDALRFEVRGFGVDVVVIEPGLIRTRFGEVAVRSIRADAVQDGVYEGFNAAVAEATRAVYESSVLARFGGAPEQVAAVIERAITARRPRARYRVTPSARVLLALHAALPDRVWDGFLRRQFPTPGGRWTT